MYTIYFGYKLSGRRKIGCDKNYPNRSIQQNLTNYRILEQHEDIFIASKREQELQAEYGLRVDAIPYWKMIENGKVKSEKKKRAVKINYAKAGLIGASSKSEAKVKAARENIKKATAAATLAGAPSKAGKVAANKHRICPHCGKEGKGPTMFRYHFNNCKQNNI